MGRLLILKKVGISNKFLVHTQKNSALDNKKILKEENMR